MTTERQEPIDTNSTPVNGLPEVGPSLGETERATRRLPRVTPRRPRLARAVRPSPSREQVASLIEALGDSSHPLHAIAVEELVGIGPAAVPALCDALGPDKPWLTVYRAAEAAGRIGDGRVAGPLIQALNHPNSNVRWSAVRALTQIGDVRALLELRRVAQHDQGRTSWGELVAGAAQSALNEIGRRSVWGQSLELIKTAVTAVLMIFALVLAFSVVSRLRDELDSFGQVIPGQTQIPQFELPTALPDTTDDADEPAAAPAAAATTVVRPTVEPSFAPTAAVGATAVLTGTVRQDANVRPSPGTANQPVGRVNLGDQIVFLAQTENGQWFLVRLGEQRSASSAINTPDGTGWVNQALVSAPEGELPVQDPAAATAAPAASPTPAPTP
jgi:hypothetical protein